jgi:glycogen(starch) synthase
LELISKELRNKKIIAHFHEWLSGGALLHLKSINSPIKTVFTTHATMLGRSMAGSGEDLYSILDNINPNEEAYKHGVAEKYFMEKACAHNAHVFTTVSEITGYEAEKILGKKPEILVLNGLDMSKFPTIEETSVKHVTCREKLREFLTYYFFPYYPFSLEHNLIYFYSGRNEFRNKGVDIFIKALGRLNNELKKQPTPRTIAVFFWVPDLPTRGLRTEILENKAHYQHIKNFVEWNSKEIKRQLIQDFILKKDLTKEGESIFNQNFLREAKKHIITFKRQGLPPLSTHYIDNEQNNNLIQALKSEGLLNRDTERTPMTTTGSTRSILPIIPSV